VLALLAVAAVVVAVVASNNKPSSGGNTAGTTATGAATIQRRNLVATDTESGTLSYANSQTVYNRLSGTITWVPQIGQVIRAGHTLFEVDNKPVLLMDGSTPAYRELSSADTTGPDVRELNKNLVALGYNPDGIVIDDEWQTATTAGIDRMQYDLGETETGKLTLGQVVFLPGPQMVQTVAATVGSAAADYNGSAQSPVFVDYSSDSSTTATGTTPIDTTTGAGTGTGAGTPSDTGTATTTTETTTVQTGTTTDSGTGTVPKTSTTVAGGDNLSKRTLQALMRLIAEQQRELQAEQRANHPSSGSGNHPSSGSGNHPSSGSGNHPSSNSSNKANSSANASSTGNTGNSGANGGGGGSATAAMTTSSTKLVVTVDLSASSQSEATIGEKVSVEMPNGSTVGGHVTAVSPVAQSSSSGDSGSGAGGSGNGGSGSGSSTVPVTVVLNKQARGGGLDQASVSVNFVQSKARHVLSVPVTALLATSGSSFAVQEASRPHKLIPVTTGLFAAGYVEITGPGIYPGLHVTDSQG
jgi:hypothetical protein